MKESLVPVVWVVGGPGSGRSTQCEILEAKFGWRHVSSGDLLRHEAGTRVTKPVEYCNAVFR